MKRLINIENYEAFLLDYIEGNLTAEEKEELFLFLETHPVISEEIKEYEEVKLSPEETSYEKKQYLKKADHRFESIDEMNVEEAMIAYWEGLLTVEQRHRVEEYLYQHPVLKNDFELYGNLFLKPGNISFDGKDDLYRNTHRGVIWLYRVGAAAVLILAVLLFWQQPFRNTAEKNIAASTGLLNKPVSEAVVAPVLPSDMAQAVLTSESKPEQKKVKHRSQKGMIPGQTHFIDRNSKKKAHLLLADCPMISNFSMPVSAPATALVIDKKVLARYRENNVLTLAEYASLKIKKDVLAEDTISTPHLNAREIMLLGVKGINSLTGLDFRVQKKKDPMEKKEYFAFTSRIFSYTRIRSAGHEGK